MIYKAAMLPNMILSISILSSFHDNRTIYDFYKITKASYTSANGFEYLQLKTHIY